MPSAANVKIDKQINPEGALDERNGLSPLRQALTIIEHKIRNLEKRKSKLESYKELQNAGKELNNDQKTAIAKFDEVIQTLEFARDLNKQFIGIAACSEKDAKKLAKKEAAAKNQAELARLREILLVQDALNQMGNEAVREDFLHGRNGAAQLTEADLNLLDELYPAVTPKHESGNPTAFTNEVQAAAEHLLAVVDGKPKEIFGGSYSQVKEILGKIHESGYFDQAQEYVEAEPAQQEQQEEIYVEETHQESVIEFSQLQQELPLLEQVLPVENVSVTLQPQLDLSPVEPNLPPEPIFFQQPPVPQVPLPPQVRPITEVLGTGSFFFLQDSEIDTPPEQIPSQTFTNQSFVTGPPPPIPMPPHFQNMSANLAPLLQGGVGNNGLDEDLKINEDGIKQGGGHLSAANRTPRSNNPQNYYQNNNGYNGSRPSRQNRSQGPRQANNNPRHN